MGNPKFDKPVGITSQKKKSKLDLFFDLQCPFSKKSWDTMGSSLVEKWEDSIEISFHAICLSHHRQSWDLTRAMHTVHSLDPLKTFSFISLIYKDQEQFYNAHWVDRSQEDLLKHLSNIASPLVNTSAENFQNKLTQDNIFYEAKNSIKIAALNQVWSTPTIIINGSQSDELDSSSSIAEWEKILGLKKC